MIEDNIEEHCIGKIPLNKKTKEKIKEFQEWELSQPLTKAQFNEIMSIIKKIVLNRYKIHSISHFLGKNIKKE